MSVPLSELIAEASGLANNHPCVSAGHAWEMEGGRSCPKELCGCSQPVFRCARCGVYDYGAKGGPGHQNCYVECPRPAAQDGAQ